MHYLFLITVFSGESTLAQTESALQKPGYVAVEDWTSLSHNERTCLLKGLEPKRATPVADPVPVNYLQLSHKPEDLGSSRGDLELLRRTYSEHLKICSKAKENVALLDREERPVTLSPKEWCQDTNEALLKIAKEARSLDEATRMAREKCDWYASSRPGKKYEVRYTAYEHPLFEASVEQTEEFRFPVYGPDKAPFYYLKSPVDSFRAEIEGSCTVEVKGVKQELAYDSKTGRSFLVPDFLTCVNHLEGRAEEANYESMREIFKKNPERLLRYMRLNSGRVFFRKTTEGVKGAKGTLLAAMHTMATDLPLGLAAYCFLPNSDPKQPAVFSSLCGSADRGGAINGERRVDLYAGQSAEAARLAESFAGRLGDLYLLVCPKVNP